MQKINVLPVLNRHFDTLKDYGEERKSIGDVLLFVVFPFGLGIALVISGFRFRTDAVNGFLNAFSIFTGLLLNVLVLVFTLASSTSPINVDLNLRKQLLREIFVNICFAIIVAIGVVCTAVVALSYMKSVQGAVTGMVATVLLVAFTTNFVLTMLMIIRRMYFLLDKELERGQNFRRAA